MEIRNDTDPLVPYGSDDLSDSEEAGTLKFGTSGLRYLFDAAGNDSQWNAADRVMANRCA